jgi:hypothetical protein
MFVIAIKNRNFSKHTPQILLRNLSEKKGRKYIKPSSKLRFFKSFLSQTWLFHVNQGNSAKLYFLSIVMEVKN